MSRQAFAAFSDKQVGTLEVGRLADLAVLSQDIFSVPPETIGKTRVLTTMVGGKVECAFSAHEDRAKSRNPASAATPIVTYIPRSVTYNSEVWAHVGRVP